MMLENMNISVDPCENFFEFSCGGFIEKTRLSQDQSGISTFHTLAKNVAYSVSGILLNFIYLSCKLK